MTLNSKTEWLQGSLMMLAAFVLGLLGGICLANRKEINLKPDFTMDGMATVAVALVLVIALNVAATRHFERRHSEAVLLGDNVKEVIDAAGATHDFLDELMCSGEDVKLTDKDQRRLQGLLQRYSNSLQMVEHSLQLCGLEKCEELEACKSDRAQYKDLITGDTYPIIGEAMSRGESGVHTQIQNNLRTLLFRIGRI